MTNKKNCLLIGYGSIGSRHAQILTELGCRVLCVSARQHLPYVTYPTIEDAIRAEKVQLAAITSPSDRHASDLAALRKAGFCGGLLIEKPLFRSAEEYAATPPFPAYIGYNLRFHPVVQGIREYLEGKRIYSMQFAVGQYLPDWRPGSDYRHCYSADSARGGGVLRDLSHELDLALWLCGDWKGIAANIGKWGSLEINSEDTVDIIGQFERCNAVNIHLDYHNNFAKRSIAAQAEGLSLHGDLIGNTLRVNDTVEEFALDRNTLYERQWREILSGSPHFICGFSEGMKTLSLVEAAESAAKTAKWVKNK